MKQAGNMRRKIKQTWFPLQKHSLFLSVFNLDFSLNKMR